ncbi:MAG: hypothetical protein LBE56_03840 [Tannerella sp.]|jgi:metal-responsive CopG/Arc/MetJ family transcriptional regulator|nr:hypothetical protein [Tannerella sp.]
MIRTTLIPNRAVVELALPIQTDLLQQIDDLVDESTGSRADIILEAIKMYIVRKQNWQDIFALGERLAVENNLSEDDVMNEIKAWRREK